ncbi:hypothetical protein [Niallia circulans]|nr:hypothetical protein [Niallia circulans]
MSTIIFGFIGVWVGIGISSVFAGRAYKKGYEDGLNNLYGEKY